MKTLGLILIFLASCSEQEKAVNTNFVFDYIKNTANVYLECSLAVKTIKPLMEKTSDFASCESWGNENSESCQENTFKGPVFKEYREGLLSYNGTGNVIKLNQFKNSAGETLALQYPINKLSYSLFFKDNKSREITGILKAFNNKKFYSASEIFIYKEVLRSTVQIPSVDEKNKAVFSVSCKVVHFEK